MASINIHRSRDEAVAQSVGDSDDDTPEIDVQTIPHAVRHAAVFGAIESLRPGSALIISATHDPIPLLRQLRDRHGEAYTVSYLGEGPERWRILIRNAV